MTRSSKKPVVFRREEMRGNRDGQSGELIDVERFWGVGGRSEGKRRVEMTSKEAGGKGDRRFLGDASRRV